MLVGTSEEAYFFKARPNIIISYENKVFNIFHLTLLQGF